jgi:RNA polymerase sigma-70 factor (ECF subfamily)
MKFLLMIVSDEKADVARTPEEGMQMLARYRQYEIAACHATAASWEQTDWRRMVALYDELAERSPSPVVELNRAVAVGMLEGPAAGLAIVDELVAAPELRDYHLLPATRAGFLRRLERWEAAAAEYRRALALTQNERERDFLRRRLTECEGARASEGCVDPAREQTQARAAC